MKISKTLITNTIFTLIFFGFISLLFLISKNNFQEKIKSSGKNLESDFQDYRIKINEEVVSQSNNYNFSSNSNFSIYEKRPTETIKKLVNVQDFEDSNSQQIEIPEEIIKDITENPLLKGYYIQLGIFSSKESAESSIANLKTKGLIDENFTHYIETKKIQERILYLSQIGVFSSKEDAVNFCSRLQRLQIGCVIID